MPNESATTTATLHALGQQSWEQVLSQLRDARCIWADLQGLHFGAVPAGQPVGTHLWAWSATYAWRLRLDPESVVGARMELGVGTEPVVIQRLTPRTTPDPGLAQLLGRICMDLDLIVTQDETPISFLRQAS